MTLFQPPSGGPRLARRSHASGDAGFSFVETVVTVVLLAIVMVPLMSAVVTSIKVSSVSRAAAQAETAMINAADRVNRAGLECDYTLYAEASVQTEGWPADRASVHQEWYDSQTNSWVDEGQGGDGCKFASVTDDLVQRVSITITTPDDQVTRTIQVVKSNV